MEPEEIDQNQTIAEFGELLALVPGQQCSVGQPRIASLVPVYRVDLEGQRILLLDGDVFTGGRICRRVVRLLTL